MKTKLILLLILLLNINCSLNNVVKHHGVHFLDKKQTKLKITETNKNDTRKILGPPSTENSFDNDVWIYIERKTTVSKVSSLGKKKLLVNNVLVLEFDQRGLLLKKDFYNKDQMNKIKVAQNETKVLNKKNSFINNILVTLRQKINDPLGQKKAN
tara:strand:- start:79 stop:543 length:465 start_codon:yes stop_codon:yes gene_type:complete